MTNRHTPPSIRMKLMSALASASTLAALSLNSAPAIAENKTYALVSVIGDRVSFSKQKKSTGTHLEPVERSTLKVNEAMAIDAAVLRGLDRILGRAEPQSSRVFLKVNAPHLQDVAPAQRNAAALDFLVSQLRDMPQRMQWDRIYVVTPNYRYSDLPGLGSKLSGVGLYVQPLKNEGLNNPLDIDMSAHAGEFETINEDGKPNERASDIYVAMYFVTQLMVLDARTLQVIDTKDSITQQKIYDFRWTAIDLAAAMKPEILATRMESFVERAAARSMVETLGTGGVSVGELKQVEPAPAAAVPRH
jgi:hypothetical protein